MPRLKQASKRKRTTTAVTALGTAGLGLSLVGGASASTMPTADNPQSDDTSPPNQRFVLGEEEMADVSLATFHLFDKENVGSGVQVARGGCGGCHGCGGGCRGGGGCGGGCGGCRGCGGGFGGCGCGGCGFAGWWLFGGCGYGGCGCGGGFGGCGYGGGAGCVGGWGACR
jgi:hypothetical protein